MIYYKLNSRLWTFLEDYVYRYPDTPDRVRSKDEPMQVICVGLPRSATESLQQGLMILGYDYTYHGWDIVFEEPFSAKKWAKLAQKKWNGSSDGESHISREDFEKLLGHCTAVTDAAASCFAPELINAYPEAKIILNTRKDLNKWHESVIDTVVSIQEGPKWWFMAFFNAEFFWIMNAYNIWLWPSLFGFPGGSLDVAIRKNGKWKYRDHCNMIRGLVPKEKLLEWSVEEGWEPLCKFLGKEIPDQPFPNVNSAAVGWKQREEQATKAWARRAFRNMAICGGVLIGTVAFVANSYRR